MSQKIWDSVTITRLIITCIVAFVLGPMIIYFTNKFWQNRNTLYINKRYPKTTMLICIGSILLLMFDRVVSGISGIIRQHNNGIAEIFWWIHIMTYSFLSHAIIWCAVARYWTMYYDFNWSITLFDNKWKTYIDPNTFDNKQNWFFKHKTTYGNIKWFAPRFFTIYIVIALFSSTTIIVSKLFNFTFISGLIDAFFFIIPLIWCLIIWCKTPKFYDSLHISTEMKYTSILFIVGLLCYIFISAAIFLQADVRNILLLLIGVMVFWLYPMIATCLVLCKMNESNIYQINNILYSQELELVSYLSVTSKSDYSINSQTKNENKNENKTQQQRQKIGLPQILRNKEYFGLFVDHIVNEFSLELLLSIIELIQFKSCFNDNNNKDNMSIDGKVDRIADSILENNDIPKSFIVHGKVSEVINYYKSQRNMNFNLNAIHIKNNPLLIRAYFLYNKYVADQCELEVNIGFDERNRLNGIFENINGVTIDNDKLCTVFDNVIHEMVKLLQFSCNRFQRTPQYKGLDLYVNK